MSSPTRTEYVHPTDLSVGDEMWHFHDGHGGWARIAAITSGSDEVLVWFDAEHEIHLSPQDRVATHHVGATGRAHADQPHVDQPHADHVHAEAMDAVDDRIPSWYAGDVGAAQDAHAQVREERAAEAGRHPLTSIEIEPHLHGWYGGDLDRLLDAPDVGRSGPAPMSALVHPFVD